MRPMGERDDLFAHGVACLCILETSANCRMACILPTQHDVDWRPVEKLATMTSHSGLTPYRRRLSDQSQRVQLASAANGWHVGMSTALVWRVPIQFHYSFRSFRR